MVDKVFTVGKKIWKVAEHLGITATDLGHMLGLERTSVIAYRKRDNANPSQDKVQSFVKALAEERGVNIPVTWFYDGEDSPLPENDKKTQKQIISEPLGIYSFGYRNLKYAGVVPCGNWGDPLDSEEMIPISAELEHHKRFAATVTGDSCFPSLKQGDLTIWHVDPAPSTGLIVLAEQKGDRRCTVKQLRIDDHGQPHLKPINPDYDEPENGEGWEVIARLVAVIRQGDRIKQTFARNEGIRPEDLL